MTRSSKKCPVADVLDSIQAAQDVGFENIKVNMVVKKELMTMRSSR